MFKSSRLAVALVALSAVFSFGVSRAWADSLTISSVTVTPSATEFTVQWTTNGVASSQVLYGADSSYGSQTDEIDTNPRVTNHSVTVSGLSSCTTYHFQAKSISLSYADTVATSADQTVTTAGCDTTAQVADATATPAPLADTGDSPVLYLAGLASLFTIILSVTKLRGR